MTDLPYDDLGDRYAIEDELDHGATARVYLARDLKHGGRRIAIKVLSPDFALAVITERFVREIRTTASLTHPHIVPFIDSDKTRDGRPYFVMQYISGETLQKRIARVGPSPVHEVVRIVRQVAGALHYAHVEGVIHRDIKPGNIMLEHEHAWVADFGIAEAVASKDDPRVTSTGVTIGTPAYMSPEQASGSRNLDGRSDIFSLGCVLYEMLAGRPPFDDVDPQTTMYRRVVEAAPSIRLCREDVPDRVVQLLKIALATKREERFANAAEFAEALVLEGGGPLTPTRATPVAAERRTGFRWKPTRTVAASASIGVGAVAMTVWMLTSPALLANRYLVTADWRYGDSVSHTIDAGGLLQDQLNRWRGVEIRGSTDTALAAATAARDAGAAWNIRGGLALVGDSVRIRAQLYATRNDSLVRERAINVAPDLKSPDARFARLADELLFDDTVWSANGERAGTRVVAARRAFAEGLARVTDWDLETADSAFRRATDADPGFGQAHLWLAQIRFWQKKPTATWYSSSQRAAAARGNLSPKDIILSGALLAVAQNDFPTACDTWDRLARASGSSFAVWYGLATCLSRDDAVIRSPRSPSGWVFRTSYHRVAQAYHKAFQLLPSIHKALRSGSYEFVQHALLLSASTIRRGHALASDSIVFMAYPAWDGDTLLLVPYPSGDLPIPRTLPLALRHERELFYQIAVGWVTSFPTSAQAREALAIALDLLGVSTAVDTLHAARRLETTPQEQREMALAEFWMRLRYAVPFDLPGVESARLLADSLLDSGDANAAHPLILASIATVTGRLYRASSLVRAPGAVEALGVPAPLAKSAGPLLVHAALGGPADSLALLEDQTTAIIANSIDPPKQSRARTTWLGRAAQLAFPEFVFKSLSSLAGHNDYMIDAQVAFLHGDTTAVRRMYAELTASRRFLLAGQVTFDALYPEAALLVALRDDRAAADWLDPTLQALSTVPTERLADPANAGGLARAIALRAEIAARLGDTTTAVRWARVLAELWKGSDPSEHATLGRMRSLMSLERGNGRE